MKVAAAARTDIGRVREANEDAYYMDEPLFVVADGMGGHLAGDVASATAVEVIAQEWREQQDVDPGSLAEIVRSANGAIWEKSQGDASLSGMGTTCTLVVVDQDRGYLAHVGDSRAYLLRDEELSQLTEDHTVVGRMVQEGRLTPEDAERHPNRNIITRALGVEPNVEVDELMVDLREGDRLLLCSDGLSSMVGPGAIRQVLLEEADPDKAAEQLIELANGAGGEDNITVVVLDVTEDEVASHESWSPPAAWGNPQAQQMTQPSPAAPADLGQTPSSQATVQSAPRSRSWVRRTIVALLVVLVVAGAGYGATRFALANSWFVGADSAGYVTIYKGIPDDIAGLTLKQAVDRSYVRVEDLPEFLQSDVTDGISVDSRRQAERTVSNLETRARDRELMDRAAKPPRA